MLYLVDLRNMAKWHTGIGYTNEGNRKIEKSVIGREF